MHAQNTSRSKPKKSFVTIQIGHFMNLVFINPGIYSSPVRATFSSSNFPVTTRLFMKQLLKSAKLPCTTLSFWHDFNFFGTTSTLLARIQLFWYEFNFFGTTFRVFVRLGLFLGSFCEPLTTFICRRQQNWRLQHSHGWGCFIWFLSQSWESVVGFYLVIFLHWTAVLQDVTNESNVISRQDLAGYDEISLLTLLLGLLRQLKEDVETTWC